MSQSSDNYSSAAFRRLVIAKQLYAHALTHSNSPGAINKIIAVHNFHNAIEIVVKAILVQYDIEAGVSKTLDFEGMLSDIDKHFSEQGKKLPYRQDLKRLNQLRNQVQHHAHEPETATMDEWRTFTLRFLEEACSRYFNLSFATLSSVDLVADVQLKQLLQWASAGLETGDHVRCVVLAQVAYEWASETVLSFLPKGDPASMNPSVLLGQSDSSSLGRSLTNLVEDTARQLYNEVHNALEYTTLLATGIELRDYQRLASVRPSWRYYPDSVGVLASLDQTSDSETCHWLLEFAVNTIVKWQAMGLSPTVPEWGQDIMQGLIENGGHVIYPDEE